MDLIFITNDLFQAHVAERAGVDRVMVDLEIDGKMERQGHLNTVISNHSFEDVKNVGENLNTTELMVRVNPLSSRSAEEIDQSVALGAKILMLPMFVSAFQVEEFIRLVRGRARTCLLLETGQALVRIEEILDVAGIDEIHIGLNDLHLALKLDFMFELLSEGVVEYLAHSIQKRGLKFGLGGIARLGRGVLDSQLILLEHLRLGSTQVILSRDFSLVFKEVSGCNTEEQFCIEVAKIRKFLETNSQATSEALAANKLRLRANVRSVVSKIKR